MGDVNRRAPTPLLARPRATAPARAADRTRAAILTRAAIPTRAAILTLAAGLTLAGCGGDAARRATPIVTGRCPPTGVAVQVLGSARDAGLPGRAGAGYALHVDGRVRVLVDLGAGTLTRLGDAGGRLEDIDALLITRIGIGPVADLGPLLDAARAAGRRRPLALVGPAGGPDRPSMAVWLRQTFGDPRGAHPELAALVGPGDPYRVALHDVTVDAGTPRLVFADRDLEVHAIGVPHGDIPAVGYRVQVAGRSVGFTGDQRADDPRFLALVRGVDLLVAHVSTAEDQQSDRHARPGIIGALARAARAGRLLVAGATAESLAARADADAVLHDRYPGPIDRAADLDCVVVPPPVPSPAAPPAAPPASPPTAGAR